MTDASQQLPRSSTGVAGLDRVLQGGLFERSVYIVEGTPGTGKTILANQMCHHQAAAGHQAVYFTLLAESHARMIQHLRGLSFFRADLVAKLVHYISGFKVFESDGLLGLLRVIRETVVPRKARLLVLDGLVSAIGAAPSEQEYKKFIHELQGLAGMAGCTVLLLVSSDGSTRARAEDTIVDGIIELTDELSMLRPLRHLQVKKLRGSGHVRGKHILQIDANGISLLPRLEAAPLRLPEEARLAPGTARIPFGLTELDQMLSGGLPACSTTLLLGATGTGKTILGLQFLGAGVARGERVLFFGFFERPHTLHEKSRRIGIQLDSAEPRGLARFAWEPFGEGSIDALGHRLLSLVREHRPKRLLIDGVQGLQEAAHHPERLRAVLSAIVDELEALHITPLYTVETQELLEPVIRSPIDGISAVTHNILLLRHMESERELRKFLSILKLRDAGFDHRSREYRITDRGVVFDGAPAPVSRRRMDSSYPAPPPALEGGAPAAKPYILIVDDEFGLAELIAELLAERDCATAIAINGQLGLALLHERRPDLVLLDLMMPVLTGSEMLRQMRSDPACADIPVVIMTAMPGAVPADEISGHQAVLQKPFTPERLFEVVRSNLRSGASASS